MNGRLAKRMSLVLLGWIAACTAPSAGISQRAPVAESAVAQPQPAPAAPVAAPSPATPPNPGQPVSYPSAEAGFRAFLTSIRGQALERGVRPATLDMILPGLSFNERVVALDRNQPDDSSPGQPPSMAGYLARRLDDARITGGRDRYARMQPRLMAFESRFGVPGPILLGIWGMETNYGGYTGNFDVLQSLATLAYDGRRRSLFTNELIAALEIVDRGLAPRSALTGSWAGAMGNPQFLPSSYLKTAVDGDGDAKADIWNSEADSLASIANYLVKAGWKRGEPWGVEVGVPATMDRRAIAGTAVSPTCPRVHARHSRWMTVAEWKALGLTAVGKGWPADHLRATLIEADGPGGRAFLTFHNYRALLDYNCSNYYAISVGLLADAISR